MIVLSLAGLGQEQDLLANTLPFAASYTAAEPGALAELTLTVKTDGTWLFSVGSGDAGPGSPSSGTWLPGGSAADFQVKFTPSNEVGAPTITNGAAAYAAVSSNRSIKVEKNGADASADVLVEIQRILAPPRTLSASTTMNAAGAP